MKLKLISLILALALCIGCFSGCGKDAVTPSENASPFQTVAPEQTVASAETAEDGGDTSGTEEVDAEARYQKYLHAYEKHDPDAVVMSVNGLDIHWRDFFSWLYDIMVFLEDNYDVTDWSAALPEETGAVGISYGSYAFSTAATNAMEIAVLLTKATEQNVTLTSTQLDELEQTIQSYYDYFGGEEGFHETIEKRFLTEEYYRQQNKAMMVYSNLYELAYGKNGERFPDDEAVAYARSCGYMYAKHILFSTLDDDKNPLPEEKIAEKKALAEKVLAELQGYPTEELEENFDRLALEYSEDPGLAISPEGYYFLPNEMVEPFETATKALGELEMSGIVESDFGYHIIFCPVLKADAIIGYNSQYVPFTPRDMGSAAAFNETVQGWFGDALVIPAEEFTGIDLNALLAP